ncbi:hypothetical protein PMI01_02209 [Caulobacter sp. AP07]|uniref:hypothetical protein n=1 Tax=Caulobacter sp. AP07 TaxID=1144304 RepID=UPI0002722030|nr:hypothetical protein [Caulobacter sp. AP07]EJL33247.1 hypothetical protein PMI01_02209 [Caulobacter sp. AP07]
MTIEESGTRRSVGRTKLNFDKMPGRFPAGTKDRIKLLLRVGETQTAFLQEAVEAEIKRREKAKP